MRAMILATVMCVVVAGTGSAQLPAQKGVPGKGNRPTEPPAGQKTVAEPEKVAATTLTPVGGGPPKLMAVPVANYMIGVFGYPTRDGVVVTSTVVRRDLNQKGKPRCPAAEIEVDFQGNGRPVQVRLEGGDKITAIGGYQVKTVDEVVVAVNSATNKQSLDITFIDWRTGNEFTGKINAAQVK